MNVMVYWNNLIKTESVNITKFVYISILEILRNNAIKIFKNKKLKNYVL